VLYVHIADGFPVPSTNFFYPIFKSISIRVDDPPKKEVTEKGVISVLDTEIHLYKLLYYKKIDYRVKPDNDNFGTFSVASKNCGSLYYYRL